MTAVLVAGLAAASVIAGQGRLLASASSGHSMSGSSDGKYESFRSERYGLTLKYKARWKLVAVHPFVPPGAASDSIPVAAAYQLVPPSPPGSADGRPYAYQYYIFILRMSFADAAHALGFSKNTRDEWTYKDAGIRSKAVRVAHRGWQGLRMTYAFRLYNAPNAQERAQGLELGSGYLGMSEGEKTLIGPGGNLSIVLEFDPDIDTDPGRDVILKSLRFFKPEAAPMRSQALHK